MGKAGQESTRSPDPFAAAHRAYGLEIRSTRPVPGLVDGSLRSHADLFVHWGEEGPAATEWVPLHASDNLDQNGRPVFVLEGDTASPLRRFTYLDGTRFWFRLPDGGGPAEVWADWAPESSSEDTSTYFLGPVLGHLLRLRGQIVLHASAVCLDPERPEAGAIALVGPPGAGKSTTAAAFARRGHPIVTEDACPLADPSGPGDPFRVVPGYPLIRLWPDSVGILYGSAEALPRLTPTWDKRFLTLHGGGLDAFVSEPVALKAVGVLAEREASPDAPRVEPLAPRMAFMDLVANTYRNLFLDRDQRIDEFRGLDRLLRGTAVFRIVPHSDPVHLERLLDCILEGVATPPAHP